MVQSISSREHAATTSASNLIKQALGEGESKLLDLLATLLLEPMTPSSFSVFEERLAEMLRELGRAIVEQVVNKVETNQARRTILAHGLIYHRLAKRTRNGHVSTLFGDITVQRFGYRYSDYRHSPEPCVFPLEMSLGLIHGVTPALGKRIGKQMATTTQRRTIQWLLEEHGVHIGAERLRKFVAELSLKVTEHRESLQIQAVLSALQDAQRSRGGRKPVLAVGRDGVTLCENRHSFWEVASVATITVLDRAGKRLLTVYLAHSPQLGQAAISSQMTSLIQGVLEQWEGPLPTLAYIADSGGKESSYFEDALRRMTHPRTGGRLQWQRVVDYYHAAIRIWDAAEALFGKRDNRRWQWAQCMLRLLKQPNGPSRVLHSAAAHAAKIPLSKTRRENLDTALNYIRRRTQWMQYADFSARHIPLGSGITEAACKTIFTQRFKQSGMRWSKAGADVILALRTVLLSGIWDNVYDKVLAQLDNELPETYGTTSEINSTIAA
ncbi:MAG: hypothetical protein KDA57_21835 [Planctomycetales bacterium]|nr:hypothetical protein [Planctomycetales bacterium]